MAPGDAKCRRPPMPVHGDRWPWTAGAARHPRLAALVDQGAPRFPQALECASLAAAVLGYVAAQEKQA